MADHFELHLTAAGRGMLADSMNVGVNNVQVRRMAAGSGSGPGTAADADARVALRSQQDIQAVSGSAQPDSGRIGMSAIFDALMAGTPDVEIRELGIFARVGDGGAEFLLAYGARPAAEDALTALTASGPTIVTGVMDISSEAADVAITVDPTITFEGLDGATDGETAPGVIRNRAVTPGGLAFALRSADQRATTARRGTVELATNAETQTGNDAARAVTPAAMKSVTATAARRGLVELATDAEARTGTDAVRAVTPAALRSVLSLITVLHLTVSNPNYIWNLPFSRALVVAKAGDGGGGPLAAFNPAGTTDSEDGDDTVVTRGVDIITATGGKGGPRTVPGQSSVYSTAAEANGPGGGGAGGFNASSPGFSGANGGRGETVFHILSGLTPVTTLSVVIGGGGSAGNPAALDAGDTPSEDGDDGWVRIIPLPDDP